MVYTSTEKYIADMLIQGVEVMARTGDYPNFEAPVNTDGFLWEYEMTKKGWCLQKNLLSVYARIIDNKGIRRGNGTMVAMKEKFVRLTSKDFLKPGDMIGISRGAYEHYAIYVGNGKVVHYAGEGMDFDGKISIHEALFSEFLKGGEDYFVIYFGGEYPVKIYSSTGLIRGGIWDSRGMKITRTYSAKETVRRAYSRIGESEYNLATNNCEHFALWCRTGLSRSTQVEAMINYVISLGPSFGYLISERKNEKWISCLL